MPKSMLIDASHPEETRVVVVNDRQLEEFDFESSTKRQLKGNIYLAKVTRVEPSLQAAFVDYGGGRHGFLAFSEIHPDYYQIPLADRHLLEEASKMEAEPIDAETPADEGDGEDDVEAVTTDADEEAEEVFAEQAKRRQRLLRNYKIQEVIKRRQILLVQVVKEERGNKGAALTSYLSLAGRYCVLMPNTARGGGISRKIANVKDRARLKTIARELDVPQGMGLIIRTAGQSRNKLEIRRDYDYLLRLWSDIRDRTLESVAPCMIHEEGALVKRAIRDIYDSDIGEILVEGDEGYKAAKKVMTMLMPSRARRVKQYKEEQPLFHHFQIEAQLDALHSPVVELKSGGSIVINPTEALTAIDVNSGRATRERNIEETALRTNSEAAEEIARQLRLRDVAGLVVIDFIDMIEMRNQRAVERRLRDALRFDRARIQLGRISTFGLLELSRQRLRPSFLELSTQPCPSCGGSGTIRSIESAALQALRAVEMEGMKGTGAALAMTLPPKVALYLLNQKRDQVVSLEQRYRMTVEIRVQDDLIAGQLDIETVETRAVENEDEPSADAAAGRSKAAAPSSEADAAAEQDEDDGQRKRRRRRRRRRRRSGEADVESSAELVAETTGDDRPSDAFPTEPGSDDAQQPMAALGDQGETSSSVDDDNQGRPARRRRRSASPRGRRRSSAARGTGAAHPVPGTNGSYDQPILTGSPEEHRAAAAGDMSSPGDQPGLAEAPVPAAMRIKPEETPSSAAARPETVPDDDQASKPDPAPQAANGGDGAEPQADTAGNDMPAQPEPGAEMQPAALMAEADQAIPRRGWWNRFVRKQD